MKGSSIAIIASCFLLSGCFGLTTDYSQTNQMIADASTDRFRAFAEGMAGCGTDESCKLGLSMAFAGGMGAPQFFKPESSGDLARAILPFAHLGVDITRLFYGGMGGSGDGQGYVVTGNNNTFSGIGNKLSADNESSISAPFSSSNNFSWDQGNETYSLGTDLGMVTDDGIIADEPTILGGTDPVTVTAD